MLRRNKTTQAKKSLNDGGMNGKFELDRKLIRSRNLVISIVLCGVTGYSLALDKSSFTAGGVGGDIKIVGITALPSMKFITRHDDNIYESASNKKSSLIGIVEPAVKPLLEDNLIALTLDNSIEAGFYDNSSTGPSLALDKSSFTADRSGGDIKIDAVSAYPSMKFITLHDDNLTSLSTNKKSSSIGSVEPAVKLLPGDNTKTLKLDYSIAAGFYENSSAESSLALDKSSFIADGTGGDIKFGGVTVLPSMKIITRHDDNIYGSTSNKKSSPIVIVNPAVKLLLEDNIKAFTLDYDIELGSYIDSSDDDYIDQKLLGVFEYHPTTKLKTALRLEYLDQHDPRGTARTEGIGGINPLNLDPDEWHSYGVGGLVSYGSPNATGRIEFETSYVTKEYDNNRQFTFDRDRDDFNLRGAFYYRIRPKTRLLFEVNQTIFDYENDRAGVPSLDSTERDYTFGIDWDRTARTTGYAKLGYREKDFDSDLRDDVSGYTWQSGARWRPRTYSTVDLSTERRLDETNGIGDSIDVTEYKISWRHDWRDHISSSINLLYGEDEFDPTIREDTRFEAGINLNYNWRRWAKISTGYHYEERDSNVDIFDYDRNVFELTLDLSF